ncbi:MAG: DUF2480 family protein [Chitinophagales bacterium]
MSETLINKVAQSGLITLDLEDFFPKEEILELDIKEWLFRGLILKEAEFRASLKAINWSAYQDKTVAVFCSTDAIIPQWAWMLVATYLANSTARFFFGTKEEVEQKLFLSNVQQLDENKYRDERIIIKGCGTKTVSGEAYLEITKKLQPVVKSLMFGEPCSTVPVYKKK